MSAWSSANARWWVKATSGQRPQLGFFRIIGLSLLGLVLRTFALSKPTVCFSYALPVAMLARSAKLAIVLQGGWQRVTFPPFFFRADYPKH